MTRVDSHSSLVTIGSKGQISLGKQFAGRQVLIEEQEPGVWLIRTATLIPDNEHWLQTPSARESLAEAMAWAQNHPASDRETLALLTELAATAEIP